MLTVIALKNKLAPLWKNLDKWGITSLGKGFYEFSFSSIDDVIRVRASASWNLASGTLKLFPWTKDFNPNLQMVSTDQDKEFVDATQAMNDDSIENSFLNNNEKFLQLSWDNLDDNVEVGEDLVEVDDIPEENLAHTFTLVRTKTKKKRLNQPGGYKTKSEVGALTYLK
ncbi:hypothetical protein KIW84_056822 [Lathyrus oleraceus]|uniref:DUF4283 domain-containing protein n=1 Tax=Pisum sativum TaxID=3888 RepID=A0A9D4WZC7_PEA|nr:hypothetical protein KIW84_056822 [Pisum sativum]